jgi:hypothetical protein
VLNLILTDPVDHTVQPAEWQAMLLEFIALLAGDAEVRLLHLEWLIPDWAYQNHSASESSVPNPDPPDPHVLGPP